MFDPAAHFIQLPKRVKDPDSQGWLTIQQDYLEVKWRLCWFRDRFPNGRIVTEEVYVDLDREVSIEVDVWVNGKRTKQLKTAKGYARFRTTADNGEGGVGTGYGTESAVEFTDFVEKAETRSIGRALAMLGFGTQFTGEELSEGAHVADSPVDASTPERTTPPVTNGAAPAPIVERSAPRQARPRPATPRASAVKAAAQQNTARIQEAHEVLGQKPLEKLNHEEAYVACQARLTALVGPGQDVTTQQSRVDYLMAAFGSRIDSTLKMYQQPRSALILGLGKLLELQADAPPVEADVPLSIPPEDRPRDLPQVERSPTPEGPSTGEGGDRSTESQPDASTVTSPDPPTIVDGYVSEGDAAVLDAWAGMMGQRDCYDEMTAAAPKEDGFPLITQRLWERIIAAVTYRASQVEA